MKKKELKLYTELFDNSKPLLNESLETLKNKNHIYDINPNLNYQIMKKMLGEKKMNDKDSEDFYNFFKNYIQTLYYDQKLDIIGEIYQKKNKKIFNKITQNFYLNSMSFIDCYFEIIKILSAVPYKLSQNEIIDYEEIINLFHKDYFVDNYAINNPLIYGTNELIFSGLINYLYFNLFFKTNKEEIDTTDNNEISNFMCYPNSIMKNIDNYDGNDKNNNLIDINMAIDEELSNINISINKSDFNSKILFINPFLIKILSNDFQAIFSLINLKKESKSHLYEAKPKMNPLIFHLLFLELILYIYNFNDSDTYISKFNHIFFFETKQEKFEFFNKMSKIRDEIIIIDEQGKEIKMTKDINNKIYTIINKKNNNEKIKFNPYDYILSKFTSVSNFNNLKNKFSDSDYFSLYKFYKDNCLFNNNELNSIFINNIKEMLSSKTIEELFEQYINFNEFICPYFGKEKEKFISQTFDIIYYFPIPFQNIAGYTDKKFGLIFINNIDRFEKMVNNSDKKIVNFNFFRKMNKISFLKIVHIHEIISHYSCVIIHSNDNDISISTPLKTFKNYELKSKFVGLSLKYDGGYKGESILFGNKIKYIYTNGALFIINNNNFQNNLEKFKKAFTQINKFKKGDIFNLMDESKNNLIVNELVKQYFNGKIVEKFIMLENQNITAFRILNSK